MPFVVALLASILYGSADFLGGIAARREPVLRVATITQACGMAALLAAAWFVPGVPSHADLAWAALAGITGGIGVLLLYHAMPTGQVSAVAPLISLIAIAVPVGVGLLLGERPGALPLAGVALGVVAIVAISSSGEHHETGASTRVEGRALAVAVASGLFIGGFLVSMGRIGPGGGLWPLVTARAGGTLVAGAVALGRRTSWQVGRGSWPVLISCGVLDSTANLLYLWAVQRAPLSLIATLVSLAPASTVVLAQVVLRERLVPAQKAGIALALVAIVLLSRG